MNPLDLMLWALALVIAASAVVFTISLFAAMIRRLTRKPEQTNGDKVIVGSAPDRSTK